MISSPAWESLDRGASLTSKIPGYDDTRGMIVNCFGRRLSSCAYYCVAVALIMLDCAAVRIHNTRGMYKY